MGPDGSHSQWKGPDLRMLTLRTPIALLCLAGTLLLAGCPSTTAPPTTNKPKKSMASMPKPMTPMVPDVAPVASVDRFNDAFGKLFKRSGPGFDPENVSKVVPAPNAPI